MPTATPAASLLARLDAELARHPPFAQMATEPRRRFVEAAEQLYYAPGETVLEPAGGPVHPLDGAGCALGILTLHDVLVRVVLDGRALETPIADVMSRPVQTLDPPPATACRGAALAAALA